MGQFSNSFPKQFSYLCEYAFRFDLSCSFCEYPFIFHCLHCSPSCFDPDSLLLAHLWPGLSWIDYISANKRFSSPKTSSRKPYTSSKQQERQKHSAETTINISTRIETSSTTTPHPFNSWPPRWATQRTPNSYDASKTPSVPPSTTQPYARIASPHTYKNADSNSPSNSFPSSPDTTDGTHAARSTSPQGTPNASVATRKKRPGTISRRAPCTENWTASQTETQPTPSHSTPDGRHGPRGPNNSPPSSSKWRYSRRSAGDSSPLPSTPCYAPTRKTPRPRQCTCNRQPLPRQRSSSHTAPTNTCSMQPPCPKRTKPTSSNSCSTNHENLPHDIPPNTGPPPRLHTIQQAQHRHDTHEHHRHRTRTHQHARAENSRSPGPPSVHRYHQPPATACSLCVRQRLPQTALPCNPDHWVCLGDAHRHTHCPLCGDLNPHQRARTTAPATHPPTSHPSFFGPLTDALRDHLGGYYVADTTEHAWTIAMATSSTPLPPHSPPLRHSGGGLNVAARHVLLALYPHHRDLHLPDPQLPSPRAAAPTPEAWADTAKEEIAAYLRITCRRFNTALGRRKGTPYPLSALLYPAHHPHPKQLRPPEDWASFRDTHLAAPDETTAARMDPADQRAYIRGLEARLREAHRWHARSPSAPRGQGGSPAPDTHQAKKTKTGQGARERASQQGAAPRPGPGSSHAAPTHSHAPGRTNSTAPTSAHHHRRTTAP